LVGFLRPTDRVWCALPAGGARERGGKPGNHHRGTLAAKHSLGGFRHFTPSNDGKSRSTCHGYAAAAHQRCRWILPRRRNCDDGNSCSQHFLSFGDRFFNGVHRQLAYSTDILFDSGRHFEGVEGMTAVIRRLHLLRNCVPPHSPRFSLRKTRKHTRNVFPARENGENTTGKNSQLNKGLQAL
jgi:hypothetical protein